LTFDMYPVLRGGGEDLQQEQMRGGSQDPPSKRGRCFRLREIEPREVVAHEEEGREPGEREDK